MARKKKRKGGSEQWGVDGGDWYYRKPVENHGRFRARRRHYLDGKVETLTLESKNMTDAKAEVLALAEKARAEAERRRAGRDVPPEEIGIRKAVDTWIGTLEPDLRPATFDGYKADGEVYKRALVGSEDETADRSMRTVTYADVETLFTRTWKDLTGRTKGKHHAMLVRFFRWGRKRGYCDRNPVEEFETPKAWGKAASRAAQLTGKALSTENARKLLAACLAKGKCNCTPMALRKEGVGPKLTDVEPRPDVWWALLVLMTSGLRLSNVLGSAHKPGLQWRMIDMEHEEIHIPEDLMKNGFPYDAPLSPELAHHLRLRLAELGRVPRPAERVVPCAAGVDIHRVFDRIQAMAELSGYRLHDLRHSWLSWVGEVCTFAQTRALAGHNARLVTERYTHAEIDAMRQGLTKLPWLTRPEADERGAVGG